MLDYVSTGPRNYGHHPMYIHARGRWEFLAALKGQCSMRLSRDKEFPNAPEQRTLWVTGPDHWHGWTAPEQQSCEVAVFQSTSVPPEIASLVGQAGSIAVTLRQQDCAQLRDLAKAILNHRAKRSSLVRLREEHAMLTLSLLVADRYAAPIPDHREGRQEQMVSSALAWFEQHMDQGPGVCDVARAAGTSPQHLRRLFRKVTGTSVKRRLLLCQIQRARQLLARGEDKTGYIAHLVGFRSHSAFSRAFRRIEGHPPEACKPTEQDKEAG